MKTRPSAAPISRVRVGVVEGVAVYGAAAERAHRVDLDRRRGRRHHDHRVDAERPARHRHALGVLLAERR
jgi:hypothetical protein